MHWVQLQNSLDEFFELLGEELVALFFGLAMSAPEDVGTAGGDAAVEGVVRFGRGEGRVSGDHDKQDDSGSEQVY